MHSTINRAQLNLSQTQIAYFCMEFALGNGYEVYSGGLGVLAADYLLEVSRRRDPIVGVGLLYQFYSQQFFDENGEFQTIRKPFLPESAELQLIVNDENEPLTVHIPLQDRVVTVQAWLKKIGETNLILLDTNREDNTAQDKLITDELYCGEKEHRLAQEMVLGMAGKKLLAELGAQPRTYHLNEGHSGFLIFQAIADVIKDDQTTVTKAVEKVRPHLVFTNHTLIPAGNDVFNNDLMMIYFDQFARENNLSLHELLELGGISNSALFSMTNLCLNCTKASNAVSQYHAEKAKELWPQNQLIGITNGVALERWISPTKLATWPLENESHPEGIEWWNAHQHDKGRLLQYIKDKHHKDIAPETLILTWARRFVDYKRPKALFWQLDWLESICQKAPTPIHFIFSGKTHPQDTAGQQVMREIMELAQSDRFKKYLSFLSPYTIELAQLLTQGSDVWLNTPVEGYEACGTSGMKAALNGVLQCSTSDGWVKEVQWHDIGWILNSQQISESLYTMIEQRIIPLYTQRNDQNLPIQWIERMLASSDIIRREYGSKRMLEEYWGKLYQ